MGEKLLLNKAAKIAVEDIVQKVMDIFEAEDALVRSQITCGKRK